MCVCVLFNLPWTAGMTRRCYVKREKKITKTSDMEVIV